MIHLSKNNSILKWILVGSLVAFGVLYYFFLRNPSIADLMILGEGENCNPGMMTQDRVIKERIKLCREGYLCDGGSLDSGPGRCIRERVRE